MAIPTPDMSDTPTAAEHFNIAEQLLRKAHTSPPTASASYAAQAQAHIEAARFLWNLQAAGRDDAGHVALRKAGLTGLRDQRLVAL